MIAAEALAAGLDTPTLRELAGLPRNADTHEIRDAFAQALAEAGIGLPDQALAERHALRRAAAKLVEGEITPSDLAATDWTENGGRDRGGTVVPGADPVLRVLRGVCAGARPADLGDQTARGCPHPDVVPGEPSWVLTPPALVFAGHGRHGTESECRSSCRIRMSRASRGS
jgi:hypothetical protein